ncbi:MAG: Trk system potassium transporter TrkA [Chlamydiia bacterium]|nr:Trk system potassium transporter TrkA [Chlamydiia bacterium]
MNVVIVGAGQLGRHLASVLSKQEHNVIIVDHNPEKLQSVAAQSDVATRVGSGTDWQMMDDLLELLPDAILAMTGDDHVNFVSCTIAKHLGYPLAIARVRDHRFLNRTRLDFARLFAIDFFLCPDLLVAQDIMKFMTSHGALLMEHFAHGAVVLRTLTVPKGWRKGDRPLQHLNLPPNLIVGLIYRKGIRGERESRLIFPHGEDVILPEDEVTLIGETGAMEEVNQFFRIKEEKIQSVVVMGGSMTAMHLGRLLPRRRVGVRIIEKDYDRCCVLAEQLPDCTIIHDDGTDFDFLVAEKVDQSDLFVACTEDDQFNLLTSLVAKEAGCRQILSLVSDPNYVPIYNQLDINHLFSPKVCATNRILSQLARGTITSLVSFYNNQAEIMEINVSSQSRVVGIPLSELEPLLPSDFLIAMIQNRGRILVAHGERIISPGDTVVVVTHPRHAVELEKIF